MFCPPLSEQCVRPQRYLCSAVLGPLWHGLHCSPVHQPGTVWGQTLWPGYEGSSGWTQKNTAR